MIFFGGVLRAGFGGGGGGRRGGGGIGLGVDGQEERRGREDEEGEKGKFHGNEAAMVAGDSAVWRTEFRRVGRERNGRRGRRGDKNRGEATRAGLIDDEIRESRERGVMLRSG